MEQIKDKKEESPVVEECKSKNGDTNTPKSAEKETNGVPEKDTVEEETNGDGNFTKIIKFKNIFLALRCVTFLD